MKLTKKQIVIKKNQLPLHNWKIVSWKMNTEWKENIIKLYKLKNPIYISITVPENLLDTLNLLYYKLQKDLKIIHIDDVNFILEKNNLSKVKNYLNKYYGSYIREVTRKQHQQAVK